MARENFGGFPTLPLPSPRVVLARERVFPNLQKVAMTVASGIRPIVGLPPMRGVWEVLAGGLANPVAATAAIDLLALSGLVAANVVGRARVQTDQLLQDAGTVQSIAAPTPILFRMLFWPGVDDRLNCAGWTVGGVLPVTATVGGSGLATPPNVVIPSPAVNASFVTSADVVDGPIDLAILAVTATSGAFTLDWLKVLAYPEGVDQWY